MSGYENVVGLLGRSSCGIALYVYACVGRCVCVVSCEQPLPLKWRKRAERALRGQEGIRVPVTTNAMNLLVKDPSRRAGSNERFRL